MLFADSTTTVHGRTIRSGAWQQWCCACLLLVVLAGCQSGSSWVKLRRVPFDPLSEPLALDSWSGPQPSARTRQWLRRYDLLEQLEGDPQEFLAEVQQIVSRHSAPENLYALAELSYIAGKKLESEGQGAAALDYYSISVANAYMYLVGDGTENVGNPFDPQFRLASDLYNGALESALRMSQREGTIRPGAHLRIQTASQVYDVSVVARGLWRGVEVERMEFARDYEIQGLSNRYQTYGLGVPLMAVCRPSTDPTSPARYYAPGMTVPMTAFLRVLPEDGPPSTGQTTHVPHVCVLELFDPLRTTEIDVGGQRVPLETDLTTPLAFSLSNEAFQRTNIATRGLLSPKDTQAVQGLYMLEPYDPDKIPVLMVHGLWSSLITWMEMFNDLRGNAAIRDKYQFWFYLYPSGQPFWITAAQLRSELQQAQVILDPDGGRGTFQHMVLVGHSMGGLICKMQTIESGNRFWNLVSQRPIDEVSLDPALREALRNMLFFSPSPSVSRLVTIGSPHRGSRFSNDATRWLSNKVIELPDMLNQLTDPLLLGNNSTVQQSELLRIRTSIDSLSPASPMLPVMLSAPMAPWIQHHNVVGVLPQKTLVGRVSERGDGVVGFPSGHLDDVASEIVVPADHMNIHRHPRTVLEVQRILLENLAARQSAELDRLPPVIAREASPNVWAPVVR